MSNEENEINQREEKESTAIDYSQESQKPSWDRSFKRSIDDFNLKDYKFYIIKSTEETKTGFPLLPVALNPLFNSSTYGSDSTKSACSVPLRSLSDNCEDILVPGIKSFLKRCYNDADKRRRSSRVCKHKPGVKHYCRRKNWDSILAKYKSEILENPLVDLGSFSKIFSNLNKELLNVRQNVTQNKIEKPLILTSQKDDISNTESRNKEEDSNIKYSSFDKTSSCRYYNITSEHLGVPYSNEMDDMSSFLAIFGLKRKVSQRETVNYDNLKFVTAEISNNEEENVTANIDRISGGNDLVSESVTVVEETINNNKCPVVNSINFSIERNVVSEELKCNSLRNENYDQSQKDYEDIDTHSEQNLENFENKTANQHESVENSKIPAQGDTTTNSTSPDCLCDNNRAPCPVNTSDETCVSLHPSVDMNSFLVENILRNGTWSVTTGPQAHSSPGKCEPRELVANNNEQEFNNISSRVTTSYQGHIPMPHGPQACAPRQMYPQAAGMNGVFPNFYGPPCIPTPMLASQLVPPLLAYNFLPMNNVMCASHPGIMPLTSNGTYVSTALDCTLQHGIHHSLSLPYHSTQNNSSTLFHKPGIHQWVNVNASAALPCWTQSTFIGGTHLPCCGGSSHSVEARSQLHYSSGYYPSEGYNGFLSHPFNTDMHVGSDLLNVGSRNSDST